jgi:hypothetical protein
MKITRRTLLTTAAAAAVVPAGLSIVEPANAAAPIIGKQVPTIYRYELGEFEVTVIGDGAIKAARPETIVANQPFSEVQKALEDAFLPKDQIVGVFTPFVVNTGRSLVLFDAGFADNGPPGVGLLASGMVPPASIPRPSTPSSSATSIPTTFPGCATRRGRRSIPMPRSWSRPESGRSGATTAR